MHQGGVNYFQLLLTRLGGGAVVIVRLAHNIHVV